MEDPKFILDVVKTVGAAAAFAIGIHQWRTGQMWQRSEKLDSFIEKFETDEQLRLAAVLLDWASRNASEVAGTKLEIRNDDVLLALRIHRPDERFRFTELQANFRDAYDALLAFFNRLETGISNGLIDSKPAERYFRYWLERWITFDRHPDKNKVLESETPEEAVIGYVLAYGDPGSIRRLCAHFGVQIPSGLVEPVQQTIRTASTDSA